MRIESGKGLNKEGKKREIESKNFQIQIQEINASVVASCSSAEEYVDHSKGFLSYNEPHVEKRF